jgi:hypothetical protein
MSSLKILISKKYLVILHLIAYSTKIAQLLKIYDTYFSSNWNLNSIKTLEFLMYLDLLSSQFYR